MDRSVCGIRDSRCLGSEVLFDASMAQELSGGGGFDETVEALAKLYRVASCTVDPRDANSPIRASLALEPRPGCSVALNRAENILRKNKGLSDHGLCLPTNGRVYPSMSKQPFQTLSVGLGIATS